MATKTAILILYYRMAAAYPFLRYASLFIMAVINIAGIVLTFIYIFQCRPIDAAFSMVDGTCIDIVALYLSSMPINVLPTSPSCSSRCPSSPRSVWCFGKRLSSWPRSSSAASSPLSTS
jgi:hypothetical protein